MIKQARCEDHLLHVLTLNPEQIMAARSCSRTSSALSAADLITVDGSGLAVMLRVQGERRFDRVTGVILADDLMRLAIPVFLLGGRPGAAELAAERFTDRFPMARVAGAWSGGRSNSSDDAQTLDRIRESGAEAVLVAYGAPAQSEWIERNRADLGAAGVRIAIGVGGAIDYAAGFAAPAPELVKRLGIEWAYRLVREPWRWRRQLVLPLFAIMAGTEAVRMRLGRT
jgi:N-acetylglucosaminyldiphosphoundecaprenol N-acetyl-beta-D-mannosaminyltransferase